MAARQHNNVRALLPAAWLEPGAGVHGVSFMAKDDTRAVGSDGSEGAS